MILITINNVVIFFYVYMTYITSKSVEKQTKNFTYFYEQKRKL